MSTLHKVCNFICFDMLFVQLFGTVRKFIYKSVELCYESEACIAHRRYSLHLKFCICKNIQIFKCGRNNIFVNHLEHCVYFDIYNLAIFFELDVVVALHFFCSVNTHTSEKLYIFFISVMFNCFWSCAVVFKTTLFCFCNPFFAVAVSIKQDAPVSSNFAFDKLLQIAVKIL